MAIYINRNDAGDLENLSPSVIQYCIQRHNLKLSRYYMLKEAYLAHNVPVKEAPEDISVVVDFPRYIVETLKGYYLGEPIKYDVDDDSDTLMPGQKVWLKQDGTVKRLDGGNYLAPEADITPVLKAYNHQTIADVDAEIGKNIGIFGESYELIYANEESKPMSAVCEPTTSFMVRDNTLDHKRLFFCRFDRRTNLKGIDYYVAYIYTDKSETVYTTTDLTTWDFAMVEKNEHFFGEVPAVEYINNSDRLGDFETQMTLINAYNFLMSDRCTDKARFVKSVLALYGADLTEEMVKGLKDWGILAGLPVDSRLEYIQKTLDENGVHVLAEDIARDIHEQSMVIDMTDYAFAGDVSGVALKLKLLSMTIMVKNKIRSFEKGLKKRFEIYNHYLSVQGLMGYVDKDQISPIFTLQLPVDEQGTVAIVKQLDGIVDRETLMSLLWFVKDPKKAVEKAQAEQARNQEQFLDTFGITAKMKENIGGGTDEDDGTENRENRGQVQPEE